MTETTSRECIVCSRPITDWFMPNSDKDYPIGNPNVLTKDGWLCTRCYFKSEQKRTGLSLVEIVKKNIH